MENAVGRGLLIADGRLQQVQVQEIRISMPWGVLAMKTWNSSELEPMLVIHGTRHNAAAFDDLIPMLNPDYYYVCVDLPGHGQSSNFAPGLPLSFVHFGAVIQRLIRHFEWDEFSIMGHSFGAILAVFLAGCENTKVKRLILIDGLVRYFVSDDIMLVRLTDELQDLLDLESSSKATSKVMPFEEHLKGFMNAIFPVSERAARNMLARILIKTKRGYYSNGDIRPLYTVMPHFSESVHYRNCSWIRCPVLLILGKQSELHEIHHSSDYHRKLIELITTGHPDSRLVYVPGSHSLHCDNPQEVAPVINAFFEDCNKSKVVSKL